MDFFEFRELLNEAKLAGGMRVELNKLQKWWNENHEKLGFYDPRGDNKKIQLMPIMYPPFDVIRSGGILIMGYNPGGAGGRINDFIDAVERAKKEHGGIPPIYDKKKGGWYHTYSYEDNPKGQGQIGYKSRQGKYSKRYAKRGPEGEEKLSRFNNDKWMSKGTRPASVSELGTHQYQASFNTMLDDMGLSHWREKLMHSNWIPFNSVGTSGVPKKNELERVSVDWVKSLIRTTKPKMIVCAGAGTFDLYKKYLGMKEESGGIVVLAEPSDNQEKRIERGEKVSLEKFYRTGVYKGIPVVGFMHWTGSAKGRPTARTWKTEDKLDVIAADMTRLLTKGPNTTVEIEEPKPAKKVKTKKVEPKKEAPALETQGAAKLKDYRDKLGIERDTQKGKQFTNDVRNLTFDQLRAKYER